MLILTVSISAWLLLAPPIVPVVEAETPSSYRVHTLRDGSSNAFFCWVGVLCVDGSFLMTRKVKVLMSTPTLQHDTMVPGIALLLFCWISFLSWLSWIAFLEIIAAIC